MARGLRVVERLRVTIIITHDTVHVTIAARSVDEFEGVRQSVFAGRFGRGHTMGSAGRVITLHCKSNLAALSSERPLSPATTITTVLNIGDLKCN